MTPPRRIAFRVEYDGTDFHGWARQPRGLTTIQGCLEAAFADFLREPVTIDGASRTDAGVHARDQLAAVTLRHPVRLDGLVRAINRRLPDAIAIHGPWEVDPAFQPRFANHGKTYCYRVRWGPARRPLLDRNTWRLPWPIEVERVAQAAHHLLGTRDFASFAARDGSHQTTVRTLWRCGIRQEPHGVWAIRISGTAFMKHMVRNLIGTLVEIGRGRWDVDALPGIIAAADRSAAGPTAPAHGLELEQIWLNVNPPPAGSGSRLTDGTGSPASEGRLDPQVQVEVDRR